jgi:hypothetical protein
MKPRAPDRKAVFASGRFRFRLKTSIAMRGSTSWIRLMPLERLSSPFTSRMACPPGLPGPRRPALDLPGSSRDLLLLPERESRSRQVRTARVRPPCLGGAHSPEMQLPPRLRERKNTGRNSPSRTGLTATHSFYFSLCLQPALCAGRRLTARQSFTCILA